MSTGIKIVINKTDDKFNLNGIILMNEHNRVMSSYTCKYIGITLNYIKDLLGSRFELNYTPEYHDNTVVYEIEASNYIMGIYHSYSIKDCCPSKLSNWYISPYYNDTNHNNLINIKFEIVTLDEIHKYKTKKEKDIFKLQKIKGWNINLIHKNSKLINGNYIKNSYLNMDDNGDEIHPNPSVDFYRKNIPVYKKIDNNDINLIYTPFGWIICNNTLLEEINEWSLYTIRNWENDIYAKSKESIIFPTEWKNSSIGNTIVMYYYKSISSIWRFSKLKFNKQYLRLPIYQPSKRVYDIEYLKDYSPLYTWNMDALFTIMLVCNKLIKFPQDVLLSKIPPQIWWVIIELINVNYIGRRHNIGRCWSTEKSSELEMDKYMLMHEDTKLRKELVKSNDRVSSLEKELSDMKQVMAELLEWKKLKTSSK